MGGQVWEVVGGKGKDGILVRTGKALKSHEAPSRLSCGAFVEELELDGERLHYKRLTGTGPEDGWVSIRIKDGDLLVRTDALPPVEGMIEDDEPPEDGILRPPEGGAAPGPHPTRPVAAAPEWLVPDGQPEKKNKLLFLSLPWAGHIVHLKRIAEWFVEHPKYEVHFGYLSEVKPDLPAGVQAHPAEACELTDIFDIAQDKLKELAMQDSNAFLGMVAADSTEEDLGKKTFEEKGPKLLRFFIRVLNQIKPNAVVADQSFAMGGFLQALCQTQKASLFFVVSPGLKEQWAIKASNGAVGGMQKVDPATLQSSQITDFDMQEAMKTGQVDLEKLPPGVQSILTIPNFTFFHLMRLWMAIANVANGPQPLWLYPSASWMVEVQAKPGEIFTGTLLPLPERSGGSVQVDTETLRGLLSSDLHAWLFAAGQEDPVVYIAFGTIVKGVKEVVDRLVEALLGGPWRVLWALPADMHCWLPADLDKDRWRVEPFVPQKEVFKCDRVRCFISHCGHNSTIEAMACGVPMVCHPFYMDQYEWARTVRRHLRAGIQVDKFKSDASAIRRAVKEVIEDPSYRANAQTVSLRLQQHDDALRQALGPAMAPKAHTGPGAPVTAALILALLKGKDPGAIVQMLASMA